MSAAGVIKNEASKEDITVYVVRNDGSQTALHVRKDDTVDSIKDILHGQTKITPDNQRLIYAGKQLEDGRILNDYGVGDLSTLHLVLRLRGS